MRGTVQTVAHRTVEKTPMFTNNYGKRNDRFEWEITKIADSNVRATTESTPF